MRKSFPMGRMSASRAKPGTRLGIPGECIFLSFSIKTNTYRAFGGGPLNAFGEDFLKAGNQWTKELCEKDSDGDGRSNGEELQDLKCTWKLGDKNPGEKSMVTHPGIPDECVNLAPSPSNNDALKIAVIGNGSFGKAIRDAFIAAGMKDQDIVFGVREPSDDNEATLQVAVEQATVVFLAVPAGAIPDVVQQIGAHVLNKRTVIDCTNPFTWEKGPIWSPPKQGSVLLQLHSLGVRQHVIKAFNTFGAKLFHVNSLAQIYMAADDSQSKQVVKDLAKLLGFSSPPVDLGPARNAAVIENLAIAWIHLATMGGKGLDFALNLVQF